MSLNLITTRTQYDVDVLKDIHTRLLNGEADAIDLEIWNNGSQKYLYDSNYELLVDSLNSELYSDTIWINGSYNYTDLNRVGLAIQSLATIISSYGYYISVSPKIDWTEGYVPTKTDFDKYLSDIGKVKTAFYGSVYIRANAMEDFTYADANNIELLLLEIEKNLVNVGTNSNLCGTFYAGE